MSAGFDRAIRVVVAETDADLAGAVLGEVLGPFAEEQSPCVAKGDPRTSILTFFPEAAGLARVTADEVRAMLPLDLMDGANLRVEEVEIARDWEHGWKAHFHPIVIDRVRIRPPWEPAVTDGRVDVVINPGMGFGTGLHPTTRGTLSLLQSGCEAARGSLVDAGTGSAVLSIAAAKLGWGPIVAFDNDPVALQAAAENVKVNGVEPVVRLVEADVSTVDRGWFAGATVLANMTLGPVLSMLERLFEDQGGAKDGVGSDLDAGLPSAAGDKVPGLDGPVRLVVSGILAGEQERQLLERARLYGCTPGRRIHEGEWVSLELLPSARTR